MPHTEALQYGRDMELDSVLRRADPLGNLAIGQSGAKKAEHCLLARRER
jgi:hypothetical protein